MEKITVLGSANAIAKQDQQNTHLLIECDSHKIMVDCGDHAAASLGRVSVEINQITDLVLTHFHADHVGSLPLLIMDMWLEKRNTPLTIYGLDVTLRKANQLLELFDWQNWKGMFPVEFKPVGEEGNLSMMKDNGVKISALPVLHVIPAIGLRVEFSDGKVITYSCDTEPCDNVRRLADKADVLLQESAGPGKGHTSPQQAGEMAAQCGVKRLVLIHYEERAGKEQLLSDAKTTFNGRVDVAFDGMVL
jgi:ribonuclease Z